MPRFLPQGSAFSFIQGASGPVLKATSAAICVRLVLTTTFFFFLLVVFPFLPQTSSNKGWISQRRILTGVPLWDSQQEKEMLKC